MGSITETITRLRGVGQAFAAEKRRLESEIEDRRRELEDLEGAPRVGSELRTLLVDEIDRRAAAARERYLSRFGWYSRHFDGDFNDYLHGALPLLADLPGGSGKGVVSFEDALLILIGDQIKAGLVKVLDAADFGPEGLPRADRLEKAKGLRADLEKLIAARQTLIHEAAEVGVLVDRDVEAKMAPGASLPTPEKKLAAALKS